MLCKNPVLKTFIGRSALLLLPVAFPPSLAASAPLCASPGKPLPFLSLREVSKRFSPDSLAIKRMAVISLNKNVADFVTAYLKKEDAFLQKIKGKSSACFQTIETVFAREGIPAQLKYLAVVESALRTNARSRVGAKGLWQLMPVTAREMGLRVSGKTDERTHAYQSTVAAAKYLRSLYAQFGDWLLVLAAYNSGPGTVYKAVKKSGSKNFWALQRFLPAESRGHVKHFIGVHYFFEGEGSVATQTAAEAKAWAKKFCTGSVCL